MKTFFSTLFAILVAAAIIWFVISLRDAGVAGVKRKEQMRQIELEGAESHDEMLWNARMRETRNQFDPDGRKLKARLDQIREASEAGKPIPPSPFESGSP
jgi:hypothetical protein